MYKLMVAKCKECNIYVCEKLRQAHACLVAYAHRSSLTSHTKINIIVTKAPPHLMRIVALRLAPSPSKMASAPERDGRSALAGHSEPEHDDFCLRDYRMFFDPSILAGKVALVTGGGSGIGFRVTELLMRYGCHAAIASRNLSKLKEVRGEGETEDAMREEAREGLGGRLLVRARPSA